MIDLKTDALTPLKRLDDGPVFDEAWQAQSLAMADVMISKGIFSASEWAKTLSAALADKELNNQPDDMNSYYEAVLVALSNLLDKNGAISSNELSTRREAWKQAYLSTPHGEPVKLDALKALNNDD